MLNKTISARDDDDRGEEGGRQRGRVDEGLQRAGRRRKRIHHAERGQKSLQKTGRQIQYSKGKCTIQHILICDLISEERTRSILQVTFVSKFIG